MSDCIFCRIVRGELPCEKLCEDDDVLAFMDIGPLVEGHALVIPKTHHDPITAMPPGLLGKVMQVVQKIAAAQMSGLHADGVNLHQANGVAAGQVVPHVHIHVVPRFKNDGHHWNWNPRHYASPDAMRQKAEAIRRGISP